MAKAEGAFRTIGEVSAETGIRQNILRYWEAQFPQLRPVTRAGNRRYYRPEDVALVRRIQHLLEDEGYTVRGVQKLLTEAAPAAIPAASDGPALEPVMPAPVAALSESVETLRAIRDRLAAALAGA